VHARVFDGFDDFQANIGAADAAFVTEEGLFGHDLQALADATMRDEVWSDFPFIVLTSKIDQPKVVRWREHVVRTLGNVTLLERPIQPISLVSVVETALRARRRQYQVRSLIVARTKAAAELEDLVSQRTSELKEVNVQLRREMAERLQIEETLRHSQKLEAVGQLTGGVAHDFNNLLLVITAGLDMLESHASPERLQRTRDRMRQAAQRGASLTRQLLAFSRRHALRPEVLDLSQHLDGMQELLDRSLRGDVHVAVDFPASLWPVEVDAGELELALLNLAVNARDAMPSGGDVCISGENLPDHDVEGLSGDFVRIRVSDTGTGMSQDIADRIFEPFFTTKEVGRGSGLGLAHVYGFAHQSGGRVTVDSRVGEGTTFDLYLPRAAPTAVDEQRVADADAVQPMRGEVLLVEDDDAVAPMVIEMLEAVGLDVFRASTAEQALETLKASERFSIVFSDYMMPGKMNGIELARSVRQRSPALPVLLTSGYAEAARHDAAALGVGILEKPYSLSELRQALIKLLG